MSGEGVIIVIEEILPRQREWEKKCVASFNSPSILYWSFAFIEPSQKPADMEPRKHCLCGVRFPTM